MKKETLVLDVKWNQKAQRLELYIKKPWLSTAATKLKDTLNRKYGFRFDFGTKKSWFSNGRTDYVGAYDFLVPHMTESQKKSYQEAIKRLDAIGRPNPVIKVLINNRGTAFKAYLVAPQISEEAEEIQKKLYALDFSLKKDVRNEYYMVSRDSAKVAEAKKTLEPFLSEEQMAILEKASESLGIYDPMDEVILRYAEVAKVWYPLAPFEAKDQLKAMGFRWNTFISGRWATKTPQIAYKLRDKVESEEIGEALDKAMDEWNLKHKQTLEINRLWMEREPKLIERAKQGPPYVLNKEYDEYQHQIDYISYALGVQRLYCADDMGIGKTYEVLMEIANNPFIQRTLVVGPKNSLGVWEREYMKCLAPLRPGWKFVLAENGTKIPDDANFVVCTWSRAWREDFFPQLMKKRWDMLVLDEAHKAKNPKAKRTMATLGHFGKKGLIREGLIQNSVQSRFLSGTPEPNARPKELYLPLHVMGVPCAATWWGYHSRYCVADRDIEGNAVKGSFGWNFNGAFNLEELRENIESSGMWIRRLISDVLDMPPRIRQVVPISIPQIHKIIEKEREFNEMREKGKEKLEEELTKAEEGLRNASGAERTARKAEVDRILREITQYGNKMLGELAKIRRKTAILKLPAVIEFVRDRLEASGGKVTVFGHHKEVLDGLMKAFPNAALIWGATNTKQRKEAEERFQTDPKCRVFVGQFQAAGEAITLTASNIVIFAELDWLPGRLIQAEARVRRISQTASKILVYHPLLKGTIDYKMAYILIAKCEALAKQMDTEEGEVVTPFRPYEELLNVIDDLEL